MTADPKGTKTYLVTGATGHIGGAVVRQLHEQGHGVRALVRDPSGSARLPAGIELAVGDLDDAQLMERLNEVIRARRSVNITEHVENITGTAPATFRDWCERHADAFRSASPHHPSTVNDIDSLAGRR
jgi:NAD(P)-dependent dehydrogenase (short-subunit alcohol dehydrogenase family)